MSEEENKTYDIQLTDLDPLDVVTLVTAIEDSMKKVHKMCNQGMARPEDVLRHEKLLEQIFEDNKNVAEAVYRHVFDSLKEELNNFDRDDIRRVARQKGMSEDEIENVMEMLDEDDDDSLDDPTSIDIE